MFRVTIDRDGERRTELLVDEVVQIGSANGLEVVLPGRDVRAHHATLSARDGRIALEPRFGADEPYLLASGDRFAIGSYTLRVELVDDDTGRRLLEMDDRASRSIYADWLEACGDLTRAEYLRTVDDVDDEAHRARLRQLVPVIPRAWRWRVARAPIARCDWMLCPLEWRALEPMTPTTRRCVTCALGVRTCATLADVEAPGPISINHVLAGELEVPELRVDVCTRCGHRDTRRRQVLCVVCGTDLRVPPTPPRDAIVQRLASCCETPWLKTDGRWAPESGSRVARCRHAGCTGLTLVTSLSATLEDNERITEAGADARFARTNFVWSVEPGRSIGPLVLGMSAPELAAAWATIPRVCREADEMASPDITTHFDAGGRCTSIGIGIDQPVPVLFAGTDLRGLDQDTALRRVAAAGADPGITLGKWESTDSFFMFVGVTSPAHFSRSNTSP